MLVDAPESSARTFRSPASRARRAATATRTTPVKRGLSPFTAGRSALTPHRAHADTDRCSRCRTPAPRDCSPRVDRSATSPTSRKSRDPKSANASRRSARAIATPTAPLTVVIVDAVARTRRSPRRRRRTASPTPPPSAKPFDAIEAREVRDVARRERRALRALRAPARARAARASSCTRSMSGSVTARTSGGSESRTSPVHGYCFSCSRRRLHDLRPDEQRRRRDSRLNW